MQPIKAPTLNNCACIYVCIILSPVAKKLLCALEQIPAIHIRLTCMCHILSLQAFACSWDRSCDIFLGQDPCLWSNFSVCTRKLGMPGSPVMFNKKRTSVGSKSQHYGAITSTLPDFAWSCYGWGKKQSAMSQNAQGLTLKVENDHIGLPRKNILTQFVILRWCNIQKKTEGKKKKQTNTTWRKNRVTWWPNEGNWNPLSSVTV